MTIEDIREMLGNLTPSDWERHMAEVTAYEAALVAERDRWRNRAKAMHKQAVQRHRRIQNMVADNLAADESNDAGFVALRARLAEAERQRDAAVICAADWQNRVEAIKDDADTLRGACHDQEQMLAAADVRAERMRVVLAGMLEHPVALTDETGSLCAFCSAVTATDTVEAHADWCPLQAARAALASPEAASAEEAKE